MNRDEIYAAIPHRPPFLFVDEVIERSEERIVCTRTFTDKEYFFEGHYPDFPVVPGAILCEASMQCGALLLAQHLAEAGDLFPVATRIDGVRLKRIVRPGETVRMEIELNERLANAFYLKARVTVDGQLAARLEFACTAVPRE